MAAAVAGGSEGGDGSYRRGGRADPATQVCGCKGGCNSGRCGCFKNKLGCSKACSCQGCRNKHGLSADNSARVARPSSKKKTEQNKFGVNFGKLDSTLRLLIAVLENTKPHIDKQLMDEAGVGTVDDALPRLPPGVTALYTFLFLDLFVCAKPYYEKCAGSALAEFLMAPLQLCVLANGHPKVAQALLFVLSD